MIPKIIHQTWKNNNIPLIWNNAVKSCKKNNTDFKYILWTHKSMDIFVKKFYPYFYNIYSSYKYDIQRCDAFRYLVLYKYGGIYLDLDLECKKSLNKFLKYDIVFVRSTNIKTSFTNSFYMCIPNHPFFKYCIKELPNNINNYSKYGKHLHVMSSTGPLFLTNMINNYGYIHNIYVLTQNEFAGECNVCNENICKGGEYFMHIPGNSWNAFDSIIYNFFLCNYKKIMLIILIVLIILIIYFLLHKNI